jgi:hypothetical protein
VEIAGLIIEEAALWLSTETWVSIETSAHNGIATKTRQNNVIAAYRINRSLQFD